MKKIKLEVNGCPLGVFSQEEAHQKVGSLVNSEESYTIKSEVV